MAPCQFVGQRPTFWECQIQLPHIGEVGTVEPFSVFEGQVFGKVHQQLLAVCSPRLASLLILNDIFASLPVGF